MSTPPYPTSHIPSDGHTTNLWHRQHEHYLRYIVPILPKCDICGGCTGDSRAVRHELCRLRAKRGNPTPRTDTINECDCSPCQRAAAEAAL